MGTQSQMSALAGIYNFDGAAVNQEQLRALGNTLTFRGPDGGVAVSATSIGMAYHAFHTSRESRIKSQPLVSDNQNILVWDGRLDNREDLLAQVGDLIREAPVADVSIVMAAHQKWGIDFLTNLVGDFALSLWDARSRTLVLARDPFGTRSLFYYANTGRIIWSSAIDSLLSHAEHGVEINDDYVAGYLARLPQPWETPYRDFHAVPPGTAIVIHDNQLTKRSFWQLDPTHEIRFKNDSDYEERFLELFYDSIRKRLRVDTPVGVLLSGGLDSSAVVCVADEIMAREPTQASRLDTISYVYDTARTSDERTFIRSVEENRGQPGYHILEDEHRYLSELRDDFFVTTPTTLLCFDKRQRRLLQIMQANGARVVFKGVGGDELLMSNEDPDVELADLIARRRLAHLNQRLLLWSQALKKPYLHLLWTGALLVLPHSIEMAFSSQAKIPGWLNPEFVKRTNLRERMLFVTSRSRHALPSRHDCEHGLTSVVQAIAAANLQEWGCIEHSYPFLHRPLVEFLQAIPVEQKVRPGESRSLMRRALRNVLPAKIVRRRGKQGPDEALNRALVREWPRLHAMFATARVCARGYMNSGELLASLERARHGAEQSTYALLKTIALEFWLRSFERRINVAH
jgi:asparagine synthase (glutamine-hydrolysing)